MRLRVKTYAHETLACVWRRQKHRRLVWINFWLWKRKFYQQRRNIGFVLWVLPANWKATPFFVSKLNAIRSEWLLLWDTTCDCRPQDDRDEPSVISSIRIIEYIVSKFSWAKLHTLFLPRRKNIDWWSWQAKRRLYPSACGILHSNQTRSRFQYDYPIRQKWSRSGTKSKFLRIRSTIRSSPSTLKDR